MYSRLGKSAFADGETSGKFLSSSVHRGEPNSVYFTSGFASYEHGETLTLKLAPFGPHARSLWGTKCPECTELVFSYLEIL